MLDLYLRADTGAALDTALTEAGIIDDGHTVPGACLDRIGAISRVTGYVDGEPVIETIDGYHANLRLLFDPTPEQLADLNAVTITEPGVPFRVWA